jgi:hypothetical protein
MKSLRKIIFKFLTGMDSDKLPNNVENAGIYGEVTLGVNSELYTDNYLFDFKNYQSQYNNIGGNGIFFTNPSIVVPTIGMSDPTVGMSDDNSPSSEVNIPQKIKVKPIDVLNELETVPTPFNLTLIDEKISILKDKSKLITQSYAKREVDALIERMENRKKYFESKEFFERFSNTTDEKIDNLLKKYELVMKTSDIFVPEFPVEAIKIMTEYTEEVAKICDKKPYFYVIADEDLFRKSYDKRDPILLVQSPFGFYWQILGAWDKEMLILSEL